MLVTKQFTVDKPYGELELLLGTDGEGVKILAKGPYLITDLTLIEWVRSDADALLNVRNVHTQHRALSVAIRHVALRNWRWPTLILFDEPEVHCEFQMLKSKHPVTLQIHYEKVIP